MSKEKPPRPPRIIQAIEDGDTALLSAAGRKGAKIANQRIFEGKVLDSLVNEKRADDLYTRAVQANEHIIDSDGVDLGHVDEEPTFLIKNLEAEIQKEEARLPDSHLLKTQTQLPL